MFAKNEANKKEYTCKTLCEANTAEAVCAFLTWRKRPRIITYVELDARLVLFFDWAKVIFQ